MDGFDYDAPADAGGGGGNLVAQLPIILWQRKWWIIIPAILGIVAAVAAVLLIPPVYRSNAIMLVESPTLPEEVIGFDGTDVIDRRIAAIRQQITARPDLIELIERHGLYGDDRGDKPLSEIIENMRSSISLVPTEASLAGSRADERTIAFELAFEYTQPAQAQAVAQDLMDRVLQLDARGNAEQATNTVQFLTDQASEMEMQIADLQSQIAQISAANGSVLSGAGAIITGGGGSYDIQIANLQRDNQALIQQRNAARNSDTRDPIVTASEQRLAAARAIYAETHPDVIFAKQALAEARELAKSNVTKLPVANIDQQIAFNNSQISALRSAKAAEASRMNSSRQAQARAPLVQQRLSELQQQMSALDTRYQEVQNRLLSARAGVRAEDEQLGERLSVVEPPVIPDEPSWPDRLLLAAIGVLGGLGIGMTLALAIEILMRPIRDPSAIKSIFGASPLGVVPVIETKAPKRTGWRRFVPSR
ncbi:MAG: Wzz/FepE/Etk N-terminal domain-containing protein [Pontixanthobacter sp.]